MHVTATAMYNLIDGARILLVDLDDEGRHAWVHFPFEAPVPREGGAGGFSCAD